MELQNVGGIPSQSKHLQFTRRSSWQIIWDFFLAFDTLATYELANTGLHKLGRCTEQTTTTGTARSRQRRRVLHGADNDDGYWKLAASADAGTECPFCSYEVEEGEEICMLICGHVFHRFCLETRARHPNPACPLCRGPPELTGSLVHEIYREEMLRFSSFAPLMTRRHRWWLRL
ncbi:hypothetical protein V6N13_017465 [Hibiscus sabdariffa]